MKAKNVITHGAWAALAVVAFVWGRGIDGGQAVQAEETNASTRPSSSSLNIVAWTYGPGDRPDEFSTAMAAVLAEANEELRKERATALVHEFTPQVLDGLTEEMIPGLLEFFEEAGGFRGTWYIQEDFFRTWARMNPGAAFAHVMSSKDNTFGANSWGRAAVVEEWAKSDLPALQNAVLGLEESYSRSSAAYRLMNSLAKTDLDATIAFSQSYENIEGNRSHAGPGSLANRLLEERGVGGVHAWLDEIDFGERTTSYKQDALKYLADSRTGEGMAALLAARENQAFLNAELLGDIANSAATGGNDEERAQGRLDWLVRLPPGVGPQREAIGEQFERYMKQDFEAAGKWLVDQEPGPTLDEALKIFVREATMDDVPTAMLWAECISDPALRAETVRFVQARSGR